MSRTDHSKGCPNGRDCGVCSPGKGAEAVLPRDRRKLQETEVDDVSHADLLDDAENDVEVDVEELENWNQYQDQLRGVEDAGMDLWDETLSDGDPY